MFSLRLAPVEVARVRRAAAKRRMPLTTYARSLLLTALTVDETHPKTPRAA